MATEIQRLTSEAAALRTLLEEVVAKIPETVQAEVQAEVQTQVETEVAAKGVPREEYARRARASGRRVAVALAGLLLLVVVLVGWNRVTINQTREDFRRLIVTCRTTGPALSSTDMAYCEDRVPGFARASKRIRAAAVTAAKNEQRLDRLEAEVAKLKE